MQLMDLLNCNAVKCCDKENHIKSKIGFHGKVTYPMFPCHTLSLKKVVKLVTEASAGIWNNWKSTVKFALTLFASFSHACATFINNHFNFKNESEKRLGSFAPFSQVWLLRL